MKKIKVGFSERHGMTHELYNNPPEGVTYSFLDPSPRKHRFITSPIKGYLQNFESGEVDLIEAVLSPVLTSRPWIYYTACFQESSAFGLLGLPLPIQIRSAYLGGLMRRPNFKRLIFWSQAGLKTLRNYGKIDSQEILAKTTVVYPAIRKVSDSLINGSKAGTDLHLLFSGAFFIKGGVNVIEAFEEIQKQYPKTRLTICSDETKDFVTENPRLREQFLGRVKANKGISFLGRVPRERLLEEILPQIDVYLLPTYSEAFGFAILEAMAYGIPVISTNYFAIPEMVGDGRTGLLIDIRKYDVDRYFKGCAVASIPTQFKEYMTGELCRFLRQLIESPELRRSMGAESIKAARETFSFEERNRKMTAIYDKALGGE